MTSTPATSGVTAAGFPADFIGVSWATTPVMAVVAVYSAADGHLIRTLTVPMPGGGPGDPRLSPDGRTVIFSRGQGSCAQTIDTVPFRGGREQVLIPMTGTGNNGILPGDPSDSADGRYLIYDTVPCDPSGHALLHIRDLGTGRELTGAGFLGVAGSVFLDHDSEVVFAGPGLEAGTGLEVLRMPSMAVTAYPVPRGCRYQALAGTGTGLDARLVVRASRAWKRLCSLSSVSLTRWHDCSPCSTTGTSAGWASCPVRFAPVAAGGPLAITLTRVNVNLILLRRR
jgi:hypothetical protein